jgi:hypothetical protein
LYDYGIVRRNRVCHMRLAFSTNPVATKCCRAQ